MRLPNNQRGAALPYVFVIFLVLAIATPVILHAVSNTAVFSRKDTSDRQANDLAVGGMESFIAYLKGYAPSSGVSPAAYIEAFGGTGFWGKTTAFPNPEGQTVKLTFTKAELTAAGKVQVTVAAAVGKSDRKITYSFNTSSQPPSSSPGGGAEGAPPVTSISTDPAVRVCVAEEPNRINFQGALNNWGGFTQGEDGNAQLYSSASDTSLSSAIGTAITTYTEMIRTKVANVGTGIQSALNANPKPASGIACTSCTASGTNAENIASKIALDLQNAAGSPVVMKLGSVTIQNTANVTWGSPSKPVTLVVDNLTFNSYVNLTVYGHLFVNSLTFNNGAAFKVTGLWSNAGKPALNGVVDITAGNIAVQSGGLTLSGSMTAAEDVYVNGDFTTNSNRALSFRNLYVTGSITLNNGNAIQATGTMYGKTGVTLNGMNTFSVQNLISGAALTINNGGSYQVAGYVYAGGMASADPNAQALTVNGTTALQAGAVVSNGNMTVNDGVTLTVNGGTVDGVPINGDLVTRRITMNKTNNVTIPHGDFLVQESLTINNHINLSAGGNMVVGNGATGWGSITIDTGGDTSSFLQKGVENPCGTAAEFSFGPRRTNT